MPMMPMMPSMPMMPTTIGGKMQSITRSIKPNSSPNIMVYLFALLFIIAASLAAAVSSGSATFTSIPFSSITGNTNDILNVIEDKNLLINTTGSVDEKDYTINITQDISPDNKNPTPPTLELNSKKSAEVNFNRYNSDQVVSTKDLKNLKEFSGPVFTSMFSGYANKKSSDNKPSSQDKLAFVSSIANNGGIQGNSSISFATITPTAGDAPQTNLAINSGDSTGANSGLSGQFVRSVSTCALSKEVKNSNPISDLDITKSQTLKTNTTYRIIVTGNSKFANNTTLTLPSNASLGDYINLFMSRSAYGFDNFTSTLSIRCPSNQGDTPFLGVGSTILNGGVTQKILNTGLNRLIVSPGKNTGVDVGPYPGNLFSGSPPPISNFVLKFVYVNTYTGFETFNDSTNFTQSWIAECTSFNPVVKISFSSNNN